MTAMQTAPRTGAGEGASRPRVAPHTDATRPGEREQRRRRQRIREQLIAWAFIAPVAIYMLVFYAYPLLRNLDLSVRDYTLASFITGEAPLVGLSNYIEVLTSPTFGPSLWNTAVFTLGSIIVQFAIGLALAVFFYRRFPLSSTLR